MIYMKYVFQIKGPLSNKNSAFNAATDSDQLWCGWNKGYKYRIKKWFPKVHSVQIINNQN